MGLLVVQGMKLNSGVTFFHFISFHFKCTCVQYTNSYKNIFYKIILQNNYLLKLIV